MIEILQLIFVLVILLIVRDMVENPSLSNRRWNRRNQGTQTDDIGEDSDIVRLQELRIFQHVFNTLRFVLIIINQ